jgi:hypothetical protein
VALVAIIAVGLMLITGGAIAYFTVLRPKGPMSEVQATLEEYFNAVFSGDVDTVRSLHVPDKQPSIDELGSLSSFSQLMAFKFSDLDVNAVDESADAMDVEVVDYTITMEAMGQSESIRMSEIGSRLGMETRALMIVKMKNVNGRWLVDESELLSPFTGIMPDLPAVPTVPAPSNGG